MFKSVCLQGDRGDPGFLGPPGIDGDMVSTGRDTECITALLQCCSQRGVILRYCLCFQGEKGDRGPPGTPGDVSLFSLYGITGTVARSSKVSAVLLK